MIRHNDTLEGNIVVEQYSSATEAGIEGAELRFKGAAKKLAGTITRRDDLIEAGEADLADGQALRNFSKQQDANASARSAAQRDAVLFGGERRA